jgi:hypothetical protein
LVELLIQLPVIDAFAPEELDHAGPLAILGDKGRLKVAQLRIDVL